MSRSDDGGLRKFNQQVPEPCGTEMLCFDQCRARGTASPRSLSTLHPVIQTADGDNDELRCLRSAARQSETRSGPGRQSLAVE